MLVNPLFFGFFKPLLNQLSPIEIKNLIFDGDPDKTTFIKTF